jgi:hypothetical protein
MCMSPKVLKDIHEHWCEHHVTKGRSTIVRNVFVLITSIWRQVNFSGGSNVNAN